MLTVLNKRSISGTDLYILNVIISAALTRYIIKIKLICSLTKDRDQHDLDIHNKLPPQYKTKSDLIYIFRGGSGGDGEGGGVIIADGKNSAGFVSGIKESSKLQGYGLRIN